MGTKMGTKTMRKKKKITTTTIATLMFTCQNKVRINSAAHTLSRSDNTEHLEFPEAVEHVRFLQDIRWGIEQRLQERGESVCPSS